MAKSTPKKAVKKTIKTPAKKTGTKSKPVVKKVGKKKASKKTKNKKEDLMCFLTSACVFHYGLPDTCYELNLLRNYRDTYLQTSEDGQRLVNDYYLLAPKIVKQISEDSNKDIRYSFIYRRILSCCEAIEKKHFEHAKRVYTGMVNKLQVIYKL